jgi:hypothetical protein
MESDESSLQLHSGPRVGTELPEADSARLRTAPVPLAQPTTLRPLVEDADDLIRALFACGFTSAAVQGRLDVSGDLSLQLTTLIDTLDQAIRGIRHALSAHEAA